MGSATALMYSKEPPVPVCGLVLDSCFYKFKDVALNLVGKMGIPEQFVEMMWPQVVMQVNECTNGMNLNKHNPILACPNRQTPVQFVHGIDDDLIPMNHTQELVDAYAGKDKDAIFCEGGHNDFRPKEILEQVFAFIKRVI